MSEELIAEIELAFAEVAPGSCGIHEAEAMDMYSPATVHALEAQRAAAGEPETYARWTDIPDHVLEACTAALSYFDPESWRFHLPAYLRYSLRHPGRDSPLVDAAIYTLYWYDASLTAHALARYATLSESQTKCVRAFLRHAAADENGDYDATAAALALRQYWASDEASRDA